MPPLDACLSSSACVHQPQELSEPRSFGRFRDFTFARLIKSGYLSTSSPSPLPEGTKNLNRPVVLGLFGNGLININSTVVARGSCHFCAPGPLSISRFPGF